MGYLTQQEPGDDWWVGPSFFSVAAWGSRDSGQSQPVAILVTQLVSTSTSTFTCSSSTASSGTVLSPDCLCLSPRWALFPAKWPPHWLAPQTLFSRSMASLPFWGMVRVFSGFRHETGQKGHIVEVEKFPTLGPIPSPSAGPYLLFRHVSLPRETNLTFGFGRDVTAPKCLSVFGLGIEP